MLKAVFIKIVMFYKAYFSRYSGVHCRFYPSCSDYAIEAFQKKGILHAGAKIVWRLLRCNPLSVGGWDPVK